MKSNSKPVPVFLMINIVILICFNMLPEGCGGRTGTEISPTALTLNMFSKRAFSMEIQHVGKGLWSGLTCFVIAV
jgi:hypothetical protein